MPDDSQAIAGSGAEQNSRSAEGAATRTDEDVVSEVNGYYSAWRASRRPYEIQWFLNAANIRGQQNSKWNPILNKLETRKTPEHRSKNVINRILPKVRARLAKFTKSRPLPQVVPANTDRQSVMDAKATEKVLDYQWRRMGLETKYEDVILWAMTTGKAFWWIRWDKDVPGRLQMPGPELGGDGSVVEIPLGDVAIELGTAFELLVEDPGVARVGDQQKIMRIKARPVKEVESRYGLTPGSVQPDSQVSDLFQYQKQIAEIGARNVVGSSYVTEGASTGNGYTHVIVKEMFCRPSAEYPKGRYVVVAGGKLLKNEEELPYDFGSSSANPYPIVEFTDMMTAGQFWPTTIVEQLIGLQKEYNDIRNKIAEQLKLQMHPKLRVPKQANLAPNAYNSEAGEKIEYHYIPGMPQPDFLAPPRVSDDAWKTMETIRVEFDDLTAIYPASVGATGDNGESGFQTNLLQEASDSVHAPDIRRNELAIEEAAFKIRRLMAQGYDVPRLVSIVGRNNQPDAFEFSADNIDEHAHVIVQAGSALPTLKAARAKMIMEMHNAALFGDPNDPATKRRVLGMLEVGGIEDATDILKRDEDQSRLENLDVTKGIALEQPMPWESHQIHYDFHTDLLKSPEIKTWSAPQRDELVRHVILHARFINPMNALMLAQQFGYQDLVSQIMPMVQAAQTPPAGGPGAPPPPQQGAPHGAPAPAAHGAAPQHPAPPMGAGAPPHPGPHPGAAPGTPAVAA